MGRNKYQGRMHAKISALDSTSSRKLDGAGRLLTQSDPGNNERTGNTGAQNGDLSST